MSSGAAFLNGGRSGRASSSALLRSNTRYTPQRGARL
jgi:hypothetical protein